MQATLTTILYMSWVNLQTVTLSNHDSAVWNCDPSLHVTSGMISDISIVQELLTPHWLHSVDYTLLGQAKGQE